MIATSPTRTRYSDAELEEFRMLIVGKLEAAHLQLKFYMRQLAELADNEDAKNQELG